jgi:hypothetical protein
MQQMLTFVADARRAWREVEGGSGGTDFTEFTCFTGTKVHILMVEAQCTQHETLVVQLRVERDEFAALLRVERDEFAALRVERDEFATLQPSSSLT